MAIEPPSSPLLDIVPAIGPARLAVSEALQQRIGDAIRDFVSAALDQARAVLQQHRALLERGAQELLEKETLDEEAIKGYARAMRAS